MELFNSEFVPLMPVQMSFWEKFVELQVRMIFISNENVQNHIYTSSPWEWLTLTRGIAYWVHTKSNVNEVILILTGLALIIRSIFRLRCIFWVMCSFGTLVRLLWRFTVSC